VSRAAPTPSGPSIPPAVDRALAIWGEAEAERAVIVGDEGAIPRIGIPEIPKEPVLSRDGRSLGSVATTARLIMIAQSRHLMPVLSATAALGLLTLVECAACGHDVLIPSIGLQQGLRLPPYKPVLDLESRLRCRECDQRGKVAVSIQWGEAQF
jgi:hypothetical protein